MEQEFQKSAPTDEASKAEFICTDCSKSDKGSRKRMRGRREKELELKLNRFFNKLSESSGEDEESKVVSSGGFSRSSR